MGAEQELLAAARQGDAAVLRALLAAGAPPNASHRGCTALHVAAHFGHAAVATEVLAAAAQGAANWAAEDGWTPLHLAARAGQLELLQLLLAHGAAADARKHSDGWQPIHLAAFNGHSTCVQALLAAGAAPGAADRHAATPFHLAAHAGHAEVIATLAHAVGPEDRGRTVNKVTGKRLLSPLYLAAANNHPAAVRALIAAGASPSVADRQGRTPLHITCSAGYIEVIEALLEGGASPRSSTPTGWTPLHAAVHRRRGSDVRPLRALLAHVPLKWPGINNWTEDRETALCMAVEADNLQAVELLLEAGADVHTQDLYGKTALGRVKSAAVCAVLRVAGARLAPAPADAPPAAAKHSPLHRAAGRGNLELIWQLVAAAGEDAAARAAVLNESAAWLKTPLFQAVKFQRSEAVALLLELGAQVDEAAWGKAQIGSGPAGAECRKLLGGMRSRLGLMEWARSFCLGGLGGW